MRAVLSSFILTMLFLCCAEGPLFASSVTNDGPDPVELSGETQSRVFASLTVQPGQTMVLQQRLLWVQHVPRNGASRPVNVRIVEDDGTYGLIQSPGGRYYFSNRPAPTPPDPDSYAAERKPVGQTGLASNNSNTPVLLTITKKNGASRQVELYASQVGDIPPETVRVKVETLGPMLGDEMISVIIVMPDGRQRLVQSVPSTIEVSPEYR